MGRRLTAVTLLELLIAIVLFSAIAVSFYSIDLFSRRQVIFSERQAKVQNEVSFALEHITREVMRAIGSLALSGQTPVNVANISGDRALRVYVDLANDGVSAGDGKWGTQGDRWRAYRFRGAGAAAADRYQLWYYPNYVSSSSTYEVIAYGITSFVPATSNNWVSISIRGCWDPTGSVGACATMQNPQVSMSARMYMPSVSLN